MKSLNFYVFVLLVGLTAACSSKSGNDAEVSEAQEVAEVTEAAVTYAIDQDNSTVGWIGYKPTGKHNGTIPISTGSFAIRDGQIEGGKIEMSVIDIQNEDLAEDAENQGKLLGHLKSDDFFDAENYPTATFEVVTVEPYDTNSEIVEKEEYETEFTPVSNADYVVDAPTHMITGNLTMRGKTLAVTFPANVSIEEGAVSAAAKFNIDRTLWGLMYGDEASVTDKAKDRFIYNTVNVSFDITANASDAVM